MKKLKLSVEMGQVQTALFLVLPPTMIDATQAFKYSPFPPNQRKTCRSASSAY